MTKFEHTPGPWEATEGGNVRTVAEPGWLVATVANTFRKQGNARLIAAAPELLETLEYVLLAHKYDGALTMGTAALSPAIAGKIQRAIDLAKGE